MTAMRRATELAIVAVVLSAVTSQAGMLDGLTGYGELRFGLPLAEAAAMTGASPSKAADGSELLESREKIAGRPALRQLWFRDHRLTRIVFRWIAEDRAGPAGCETVFDQMTEMVAQRYGRPVQGPTEQKGADSFSGGTFWVFRDGANIGLSVSYEDGRNTDQGCRAMLSYRETPNG